MTRYLSVFIAAFLFCLPPGAHAAPMTEENQNVEEPDAPDEDTDMASPAPIPPDVPMPAPAGAAAKKDMAKPPGVSEEGDSGYNSVVLQELNKVTAHSQTIVAPIGSVMRFGTIEITPHSCWKSSPDAPPENAALLEISEIKQGEAPQQIFLGWMFSSSPGLSALEHPFYDVTVVGCEKGKEAEMKR